ncbi:unnamed protein product, partial [marine sediment metagenome]
DKEVAFADGNWHHYANTYDGAYMRMYLDGEEIESTEKTGTISGLSSLIIGRYDGTGYYFDGILDELRVYNRTLTPTEINWSYLRGNASLSSNVSTEGLVLYLPFNESSGNLAQDYSNTTGGEITSKNNGTLTNYGPMVYNATGGKFAGAFEFDGVNDYVDCGNDASLNIIEAITVGAWVKPNNVLSGNWPRIISKGENAAENVGGYALYLYPDEDATFMIYQSGNIKTAGHTQPLTIGEWNH